VLVVTGIWHPHSGGLLLAVGRRVRCAGAEVDAGRAGFGQWAKKEENDPFKKIKRFSFYFQIKQHTTQILSNQKSFLDFEVKIKVVRNLMIYNFAKRSKVKIPTNFEIGI
jgi:hypothetical protein